MNRRGFLAALAALPAVAVGAAKAMAKQEYNFSAAFGYAGKATAFVPGDEIRNVRIVDRALMLPVAQCKYPASYEDKLRSAVADDVVDVERRIFRASNGGGHICAYDGCNALTFDRDYRTSAELIAATGQPGRYATCKAEGLWRPFGHLDGLPAFQWWSGLS